MGNIVWGFFSVEETRDIRNMESKVHQFKKNPYNYGKNSKGQKKRGKPKSGETGSVYMEDGQKRAQSLYQRKNTIFKKAKEIHTTTKAEVMVVIKPTSGKSVHWCTRHFEEVLIMNKMHQILLQVLIK